MHLQVVLLPLLSGMALAATENPHIRASPISSADAAYSLVGNSCSGSSAICVSNLRVVCNDQQKIAVENCTAFYPPNGICVDRTPDGLNGVCQLRPPPQELRPSDIALASTITTSALLPTTIVVNSSVVSSVLSVTATTSATVTDISTTRTTLGLPTSTNPTSAGSVAGTGSGDRMFGIVVGTVATIMGAAGMVWSLV
jgi:hypothetical protein